MPDDAALSTVCLIGLGRMGVPMALNLMKAGFSVRGHDVGPGACDAAAAEGVDVRDTAAEAAAGADVIVTMLPDGAIVREALIGAGGVLDADGAPRFVVDMSSSAPTDTVALGETLGARGVALVDAPVSGGRGKAVDGTLTIMVGGAAEAVARARPLFEAMGGRIFDCGGLGAGHAMKALNNYVSGAGAVAAMEAVIVGRSFGLEPDAMVDILNVSTGRNNTTEAKIKQFVLSRSWGSGFGLALMAKDIGIAAGLARAEGIDVPTLPAMAALWGRAAEALEDGADHTEIFRFLEEGAREE